jgi:MFS superfamily sulfate permease-like transporter
MMRPHHPQNDPMAADRSHVTALKKSPQYFRTHYGTKHPTICAAILNVNVAAFSLTVDDRWLPKSVLCLREYSLQKFVHDVIAGMTVGLIALPLAAFAIALA